MAALHDDATGFTRKTLLRHPNVLIESVCDYCGFSIIASAPQALDRQEAEHRHRCERSASASASS